MSGIRSLQAIMNVPFLPLLLSKSARRRLLAACLHCARGFAREVLGQLLQREGLGDGCQDEMQQHVLEQCTKERRCNSVQEYQYLCDEEQRNCT